MRKIIKKLTSIFVSLLIVFSVISVDAFANSGKSYIAMKNGFYYLVSSFSDEENIVFQLGRKGPNKLFEIIKVSFANTGISYENAINNGWTLYESYTDHFGPYGIVAENGDENFTGTFTGGNHGYENSGDTSIGTKNTATGRCISLNVYADGVLITEGNGRYANEIVFDWVNGIQAANTKRPDGSGREVLTEHYRMVFDGKQFNIQNDITALENITITPYYGNQAIVGWATDGIKYVGNSGDKWYPANAQHNSGNQTCSSYIAKKGVYHMQISYDPTYGLGKGEHFGSSPSVMIEAYGKGYFSFFRDGCYAPKGSTFSYRGSYRYYYDDGKKEESVNLALNKSYTKSVPHSADGSYMDAMRMDTNNMELTDGIIPSADYWNEYGWVHWIGAGVDIIVDLETSHAFDETQIVLLNRVTGNGVDIPILPDNVKIAISDDNKLWTEIVDAKLPVAETTAKAYTYSFKNTGRLVARYVKFTLPQGCWNLVGEVRVIDNTPEETYLLYGGISSSGDKNEDVTVQLIKDGNVLKTTTVKDAYEFEDVKKGKYVIKTSKSKHAPREYKTEVGYNTIQDVVIRLYGDVNGDGIINNTDVLQMNRKTANLVSVFDISDELEYKMKVANITAVSGNDNIINNMDVLQMNRKIANLTSAFDNIK